MTVSTSNTSNTYLSDGARTTYPFTFQIISDSFGQPDASTVQVSFNGILQANFITVEPNQDQELAPGGTISLTNGAQASGTQITIQRVTPKTQTLQFPLASKLNTAALEVALDQLTMIAQESAAQVQAAFGFASPLPGVSTAWPTPVAGGIPVWDAAGTAIEYILPTQAHYVLTDNGLGNPPSMQASSGGGGGGGGVFGPITTTPFSLAVWANNSGTAVADGPALGADGEVLTSSGPGGPPSFKPLALSGPVSSTDHTLALWNGVSGGVLKDGPALPDYKGLPLTSNGKTGAAKNDPVFQVPPPNPFWICPALHRRQMVWQALNNAATNLTAVGASPLTVTGTITSLIVANVGKFQRAQTAAALNASAGWISPTIDETNLNLNYTFAAHVYTDSVLTTRRMWYGMVNSDPVATDTLIDGCAFRFSTSAGDVNWQAVVGNGGLFTVFDTGVPVTVNTEYRFFIDATIDGIIYFWINEVLVKTITTTLPNATDGAGPCARIRTLAAVAAKIIVGKLYVESL